MKKSNFLFMLCVSIFTLIVMTGCMKEDPVVCSCAKEIQNEKRQSIFFEKSAMEAPISGHCSDLYYYKVDTLTGFVTTFNCS